MLNPITYAEKVVGDVLRYRLTPAMDPPADLKANASPRASAATDLFGQPLPTDLLGNVVAPRTSRRRR